MLSVLLNSCDASAPCRLLWGIPFPLFGWFVSRATDKRDGDGRQPSTT